MHPVIRILNLLLLAGFAPWLPPAALFVVALLLMTAGFVKPETGRHMLIGLRRIRWLVLSLLVLFFWFTPGQPLFPMFGRISPTVQGLQVGAHRLGILFVMVGAAAAFIGGLQPAQLTATLRQLLRGPLRTEATLRFAERIGLLLVELPNVEARVRTSMRERDTAFADRAAGLLLGIERDAAQDMAVSRAPVSLPDVPRPQWLLPVLFVAAGILLTA